MASTSLTAQPNAEAASSEQSFDELKTALAPQLNGRVLIRAQDEEAFAASTRLFNSAARLGAGMVVQPRNTQDVVTTIRFCREHSLSPSIKSGGYATGGWSIQGDVVIDMQSLDDVALIHPDVWKPWRPSSSSDNEAPPQPQLSISVRPGDEANPVETAANATEAKRISGVLAVHASSVHAVDKAHFDAQHSSRSNGVDVTSAVEAKVAQLQTLKGASVAVDAAPSSSRTRKADEAFPASSSSSSTGASPAATRRRTDDSATMPPAAAPRQGSVSMDSSVATGSGESHGERNGDASEHPAARHEARAWVDRVARESHKLGRMPSTESDGAQSGASAGRSTGAGGGGSGTSSIHSVSGSGRGPTSIDSESPALSTHDKAAPLEAVAAGAALTSSPLAEGVPWNPTSQFEHERWQRHHCPPAAAADALGSSRVVLPSSGGFIWREGQDGSAAQALPWDGAGFTDSTGAAWPASSADVTNGGGGPIFDLSSGMSAGPSATRPRSTGSYEARTPDVSPPVPQVLPYVLASIGPGAGIRGIDSFTDKAGRMSTFVGGQGEAASNATPNSKGKGRAVDQPDVRRTDSGLELNSGGVPYHVPLSAYPVGSASILTGGFGVQTRSRGLSLQNCVEIEMVLADGRVVVLNEGSKERSKEEADLWWAARGAASCFGIVTRMVVKAFPIPSGVYSATLIYPLSPTCASLLRHWRDCLKGAGLPRELYANAILTAGPDAGSSVVVFQICSLGAHEHGEALVQALSSWPGERSLLKSIEPNRSFVSQQDSVAQVLKGGDGRRWTVRGDLISNLTDECIGDTVARFCGMGTRAVWIFELVGGAVNDSDDVDECCLGSEAKSAQFTVGALQQWTGEEEDTQCQASVDGWVADVLSKVSVGGPFPCFLERNESRARCQGAFGRDNFERLLSIKRAVDPTNVFRHTFADGLGSFADEQ